MEDREVSVMEAARLTGYDPETIRRHIREGKLQARTSLFKYVIRLSELARAYPERYSMNEQGREQ